PLGGLGHLHHLQAFLLGLLGAGGSLAQGDRHVLDAAIAQVQRVRVTLAAVADDRDLLGFDEIDVGITVVINAHGSLLGWVLKDGLLTAMDLIRLPARRPDPTTWSAAMPTIAAPLEARRPAADCCDAGTGHLDEPELGHDLDELLELAGLARHLEHE